MDSTYRDRWKREPDSFYYLFYMPNGAERISTLGREITVPAHQIMNKTEELTPYCYFVKKGRVICYDIDENGRKKIYSVFTANSLFLEECLLFFRPCNVYFETTIPSVLKQIERCDLMHAFKNDVDMVMDFNEYLSAKYISSMDMMRLNQHKKAEWRVCKLLEAFMDVYGVPYEGRIMIHEKITHQMMADILGINRVTITKIFKRLREAFLDQINGYYCVRSRKLLHQYMDQL
ncbi:MAG: Crp/Fnr family transcriptional regulator [Clostridiales bacterium]|nr:Crp/Fnr family transcriptional regulator [Clostridiales bacterium]